MGKIKFTKTELKKQQDAKKQFERFLPTLQLKKQQLQFEVRHSVEMLENNARELAAFEERLSAFVEKLKGRTEEWLVAGHEKPLPRKDFIACLEGVLREL